MITAKYLKNLVVQQTAKEEVVQKSLDYTVDKMRDAAELGQLGCDICLSSIPGVTEHVSLALYRELKTNGFTVDGLIKQDTVFYISWENA